MSASERLRRLGEGNTDAVLTTGAGLLLLDTLPEIVAVVEAAYQVGHETENGEHTYPAWVASCPLCDALAALEEKLSQP